MDTASLQKNGYLYVKYPPELRLAVEESVSAWKAFCELPDAQKVLFAYEQDVRAYRKEIRSASNALLGHYNPTTGKTHDRTGNVVSNSGDTRASLIPPQR